MMLCLEMPLVKMPVILNAVLKSNFESLKTKRLPHYFNAKLDNPFLVALFNLTWLYQANLEPSEIDQAMLKKLLVLVFDNQLSLK